MSYCLIKEVLARYGPQHNKLGRSDQTCMDTFEGLLSETTPGSERSMLTVKPTDKHLDPYKPCQSSVTECEPCAQSFARLAALLWGPALLGEGNSVTTTPLNQALALGSHNSFHLRPDHQITGAVVTGCALPLCFCVRWIVSACCIRITACKP